MRITIALVAALFAAACHDGPSSPATLASSRGDVAAMQRLLEAGTSPNARDDFGYTPLIAAAREGDVPMIKLLVSHGADPNLRDGAYSYWTPLLHAIHKAQPGSVAALIAAGADLNGKSSNGTTPLMMAAGYGYADIVTLLLRRGASPALETDDGLTALDLARAGVSDIDRFTLFRCQDDTVKTLLAADSSLRRQTHATRAAALARTWARVKHCGA